MPRFPAVRLLPAVVAVLLSATPAAAQPGLTIQYNFDTSTGFYSAAQQTAIQAAGSYIATQLDARGTITIDLDAQAMGTTTGTPLAYAGSATYYNSSSTGLSNGVAFKRAMTGSPGYSFQDNYGTFNSSTNWYTGSNPASIGGTQYDLQSVALHETTHVLGFASLINVNVPNRPDGSGVVGNTPGTPDVYARLDSLLRAGPTLSSPKLINPDYSFNTANVPISQISSGNNYFFGEIAMAANGGNPVQMSTDNSHINNASSTTAVMLTALPNATTRRAYTNLDLAILIDIGWNQFVWKGTTATGNWADNAGSASSSKWQSVIGDDIYSPLGSVTPNLVLTFAGNGSSYTSTNNLNLTTAAAQNRFLVNRIILTNTGGTTTIASNGTNVLRFDTTIGVTPLIRQDGAAAVNITHPIELTNAGLQLGGDGPGLVTLSGAVSVLAANTAAVTKIGTGTFVLTANNTYNGTTTVSAGTLRVDQSATISGTGTGNVQVTGGTLGGTLGGTGRVAGGVTVQAGGRLYPGTNVGTVDATPLKVGGGITVQSNGVVAVDLGSTAGMADNVSIDGPSAILNFLTGAKLQLGAAGFNRAVANSYTLFSLPAGSGVNIQANGLTVAPGGVLGQFVQGTGPSGTVTIDPSAYGLTTGDTFVLSRSVDAVTLTYTPVPEPAAVLALAAVVFGIGAARRRVLIV